MASTHAPISASALPRISKCPASYLYCKDLPSKSNAMAERGTLIHELAEKILSSTVDAKVDFTPYSNEDLQIAADYCEYVESIMNNHNGKMLVEVDLTPSLQIVHELLGGTADCIIHSSNTIHCIDLKTGFNIVKPSSIQLKVYLLGAWIYLGEPEDKVLFGHIFQPGNNYLPVQYDAIDMKVFKKQLLRIVEQATDPFEQANPGYEQCRYCLAKPTCPAIREKAVEHANKEFNIKADLADLPDYLEIAETLQGWIDVVKEAAKNILEGGGHIEGYKLQAGRKMQSINNEADVIQLLKGEMNIFELKSLAQLKKLGYEIPEQYIDEKVASPSLKRIK